MNQAAAPAGQIVAPNVRDLDALAVDLHIWLSARMPDARDLRVVDLAYPMGAGQSHETILFDIVWTENGVDHRKGLVVRIKPSRHLVYQDDMFDQQFAIMRALFDESDVRIARPLWLESDPTLLGAPFFVMEKVQGNVAVSIPPYAQQGWLFDAQPAQRRILWEDSVRQLAAIQRVPISAAPWLAISGVGVGLDQEWDRWRRYREWVTRGHDLPFIELVWARLGATKPSHQPDGIAWGDSRLGNMMVGPDFKVTAVMDWEQPSLGGALHDLGWWLFTERLQTVYRGLAPLAGMGQRDETISLWETVSGKSADDIEWYEQFAAFKMCCLTTRMLDLKHNAAPGQDYGDNAVSRALADLLGWDRPAPIAG